MRSLRQRFRRRKRHREGSSDRVAEARRQAYEVKRRERAEAARAQLRSWRRQADDIRVAVRGGLLETRRRLRPVYSPFTRAVAKAAPYISGVLLLVFVRAPAALIGFLLGITEAALGWVRAAVFPRVAGVARWVLEAVTPVRAVAVVAAAAAVAMAVSQFFDYRGVGVSEEEYQGEIGTVAPAPLTELEKAGSAHLYVLIPLAVVALVLIVLTARGRWRLGRGVALVGVAGVVVSVLVDAPQGLDAGRAGVSYIGTNAHLIEGFWAQVAASGTLVVTGLLLAHYAKQAAGSRGRAPRRGRLGSRRASLSAESVGENRLEPGT